MMEWHTQNFGSKTHPVDVCETNSLGLYGMTGNVEEWCLDWCVDWSTVEAPYGSGLVTDPAGPPTGDEKICKGGLSHTFDGFSPAAYRDPDPPRNTDDFLGFRVVLGQSLPQTHPDGSRNRALEK
jgi:formylglycine-generating enzyme required for sulfatase activity